MEAFTTLTSLAVPLRMANVDTDQLIPARFLKQPRSWGYDAALFHDLRRDEAGAMREDFVLAPGWQKPDPVRIGALAAAAPARGRHALDAGFRCVIAPSFGDILFQCHEERLLPVILDRDEVARICARRNRPQRDVDRRSQAPARAFGRRPDLRLRDRPVPETPPPQRSRRHALALEHEAAIAEHEARLAKAKPGLRRPEAVRL